MLQEQFYNAYNLPLNFWSALTANLSHPAYLYQFRLCKIPRHSLQVLIATAAVTALAANFSLHVYKCKYTTVVILQQHNIIGSATWVTFKIHNFCRRTMLP